MQADQLEIEVAYALPQKQEILTVTVDPGTTVKQAIEESGICYFFKEIDLEKDAVGIWSKATKLTNEVKDGDRIEIYRALIADPKEVRKRRAEKAKEEGRADKVTGGRVKAR